MDGGVGSTWGKLLFALFLLGRGFELDFIFARATSKSQRPHSTHWPTVEMAGIRDIHSMHVDRRVHRRDLAILDGTFRAHSVHTIQTIVP